MTTNGTSDSFTYDEVGNLVSDSVTDTGATTFTYDSANRLTRSDYTEEVDGATPVTTYYGWDAQNAWRTCQGPNASPTQANSPIDLSYNALGRMSAYANSDANTSATYTYDASGQRTKKEVTVSGTTTTTSFAYDGLTLLKLTATQGGDSWRIDYLCDEEGALWGGVYRSPAGSTSPVYFSLITSDRGDVAELCDADGNAFAAYRYDAWGLPQGAGTYATGIWTQGTSLVTSTLAGQIASRQVLRYASYAWDAESALYYCSARYYDPATRQWTTGDPAKADGEESAYQYCGGEPVGAVDESGRFHVHVDVVPQDRMKWCWAASAVCVIEALTGDVVSQDDFVEKVKGKIVNEGLKQSEYEKFRVALRDYGVTAVIKYRHLRWDEVRHHLRFKRPMLCRLAKGDAAHMVVLFSQFKQDGARRVGYMDPGPYSPRRAFCGWFRFLRKGWGRSWECFRG